MKYISLLLIMLLAGCSALGPNFERPEPNLPETFSEPDAAQTDAAEVAMQEWWTYYQDEKLNELVGLALQNNTNIQLAAARIEEADAKMREVGAYLFPEVNLSAEATRSRVTELGAFPTFTSPIRNNYTFGLNTSYEIDFWGRLTRSKEAARASALLQEKLKILWSYRSWVWWQVIICSCVAWMRRLP